jgi:hypothetical protein
MKPKTPGKIAGSVALTAVAMASVVGLATAVLVAFMRQL